jgi:hypothetical protein
MKSQPVKVGGKVVGVVVRQFVGGELASVAYRIYEDGGEQHVGTFADSEAGRLQAIDAVEKAVGEPAP